MKWAIGLSVVVLVVGMVPSQSSADELRRNPWYLGFSLGTGMARVKVGDENRTYTSFLGDQASRRLCASAIGGWTNTKNLMVGLNLSVMRQEGYGDKFGAGLQHAQLLVSSTYFPRSNGRGLFLRAGMGAARFSMNLKTDGGDLVASSDGMGFQFGVGYSLTLIGSLKLNVANDIHVAHFFEQDQSDKPSLGWFSNLNLGVLWN